MPALDLPPAPPIEGARHVHSGQGARPLRDRGRAARRRPADGRQRPDLRVRPRAATDDPRQGRDPHPDVAVVVRPARRPGAEPRGLDRRARRRVRGRAVVCERLEMYPVECVARGYLTGSGLLDYRATGAVCGIALPEGLVDGSRLPEPIFTPATKAELGEHDENVSYDAVVATGRRRGRRPAARPDARRLRPRRGRSPASAGSSSPTPSSSSAPDRDGTLVLADEVLTPDSSRFWPADRVGAGPRAAVVRQADRPQLAALAGVRLGPRTPTAAPAAAGRGRGPDPGAVRRGLRAAHRPDVLRPGCAAATVSFAVPAEVAFDYLADPSNRPEWQL